MPNESTLMKPYPKINGVWKRDDKGQFLPEWSQPEFEYLRDLEWTWTEKVDGTNIRMGFDPDVPHISWIAGRTDKAQIQQDLLKELTDLWQSIPWEDNFDVPVTIYGEGYGPKIQKGGGNYSDKPSFVVFDILIGQMWLLRESVEDICEKTGLTCVPQIQPMSLLGAENYIAESPHSAWGDFPAEGIVGKPACELFDRRHKRVMVKIKRKDYL